MRPRIATKLALLLVPLVLVPFSGLAYFWYSATRSELESQVREELRARLGQFVFRLRPFLRERELDLRDIASSPAVADYHTQLDYRLLEEAEVARRKLAEFLLKFVRVRENFVAQIRYINEKGVEVVAVTREGIRPKARDRFDMPFFQRARQAPPGDAILAAVEQSDDLGLEVFRLGLPIHNQWHEFQGVMTLDVAMDYIYAMLGEALAGRPGTPFLIGEDGTILGPPSAREELKTRWVAGRGPDDALGSLVRSGKAIELVEVAGGERGLLLHLPVGANGWTAGLLAPLGETEARVNALQKLTFTYGGIAVVVLVGIAALVARGASRRVWRLQAATAQVAGGNFALRLPVEAKDELGELAISFNTMAESLARRDAEVRARTEEAQRRRQEVEVLNAVIHAAHTSLNLPESLGAILESLMSLFGFYAGAVRLLEPGTGALVLAAWRGLRPSYAANPVPLRVGEGHVGRAVSAQRPLVFNEPAELAELQERVVEGEPVGGAVFIPILAKGRPLGAIALVADRPMHFTDAEFSLLASIGLEVGSAIENARLFSQAQDLLSEAERHRARAEALADIGRALTETLDVGRMLDLVVERTREVLGADAAGILRQEGGALRYIRSRGFSPEHMAALSLEPGEGVAGVAARDRAPAWTADVLADSRFPGGGFQAANRREGIRAVLAAPILLGEDLYGVLCICHRRLCEFPPQEVNFAAAVAQQAAIAITNARLYEQAVVKAEESAALYEAGQAVTQSLDLDATLGQIVGSARRLAGADRAFVWLVNPADSSLRAGTASGQGSESFRGVRLPADSPAAAARAAREGRPLTVENALDPTVADPALSTRLNNAALLAIPLHVQATIVGVLVCGYNAPRAFASAEVDRLAGLAHQAAIAIHNARLFADLQAAYQQLKAAQEQAVQVEKLRALGEMAGGVAHDFNNLLTAILGRAQLLRATLRDPRAAESLGVIERAALDGAETVRRILGFARARGPEQMESVEVAPLLGQVVEVTRPRWKDQAQSRGADIAIQIAAEPVPPVRANPAELREVLVNLVFNAVDALAAGGTITLGARLHRARAAGADGRKEAVEIFVRDTGVGMPEEVRRRAFDPFFTTKGVKGTGLGLSVVYGIVSRHGGTVEIHSRQGHGTTVTVQLPAAGSASRETAAPAPARAGRARILVVDDEEALAHLLAEILRMQGHAVEAVTSPREALDRLQAEGADLLFTDLGMPDLSGWEMTARARELCPGLRVILVTGWGHQLDPAEVEASGVAGIVAKPYRMEDIREAVAAALRPQPQPA